MFVSIWKVLSLLIALAYAAVAIYWGGAGAWKWVAGLLAPLALIWFPDEIGSLTGYFQSGYVNVQTPGPIISFIGWFLLVAPGVVCLCFVLR